MNIAWMYILTRRGQFVAKSYQPRELAHIVDAIWAHEGGLILGEWQISGALAPLTEATIEALGMTAISEENEIAPPDDDTTIN